MKATLSKAQVEVFFKRKFGFCGVTLPVMEAKTTLVLT